MIELITIVAILAIMAAVIIPNTSALLKNGNLDAANTELENMRTASLGYRAQHDAWPTDSTVLASFIGGTPKATYVFDNTTGFMTGVSGVSWTGIRWSAPSGPPYTQDGKWIK